MRSWKLAAAAVVLAGTGLFAIGQPAYAGNGVITHTGSCNTQNPSTGTAHAKVTSCVWDTYDDTIDEIKSWGVTFNLTDPITDGYCAYAKVSYTVNGVAESATYSECTTGKSKPVDWSYGTQTAVFSGWKLTVYYKSVSTGTVISL
jgi:hypothetical protein